MPELVAVNRDGRGVLTPLYSASRKLLSARRLPVEQVLDLMPFSFGWSAKTEAQVQPLYVGFTKGRRIRKSKYYEALPPKLKEIFGQRRMLFVGDTDDRDRQSDYRVLFYYKPFGGLGRVGVLLDEYSGEPVKVKVGSNEYVIEVKGVGSPSNRSDDLHTAYDFDGSTSESLIGRFPLADGKREFRYLQKEKGVDGGQLPLALIEYEYNPYSGAFPGQKKQAYLLRLSPTTIRAGYQDNDALPAHEPTLVAKGFADSLAWHLKQGRFHSSPHPENLLWTGRNYVLADYADLVEAREVPKPKRKAYLKEVLEHVNQYAMLSEQHKTLFYATLCSRLDVPLPKGQLNPKKVANAVWTRFLSRRLRELGSNRVAVRARKRN